MGVFDKLTGEINHLLSGFLPQPVVGNMSFGITQYTLFMFISIALLLIVVFVAKSKQALVPQGRFVNGFEALFVWAKEDMCDAILGSTSAKHTPFILSVFFFILANNVVGIIPGCRPGTGTIGVTFALALVSFIYFFVQGIKVHGFFGYLATWAPSGIAAPIAAMVWVIELISTFIRLFTLAIRLFANMFAGHIAIGAFAILTSLFIEPLFAGITGGALVSALPAVAWMLILVIVYIVELLVAVIQAYVFTLLSSVYIQLAEAEH